MHWRVLLSPPMRGAENMALDEALLERARESGEGVVRIYSWSRPTLSLGRNQTALGSYDAARARTRGVDVVRRPTGGRALYHHREITYSVTARTIPGESLRRAYDAINTLLAEALNEMGVDVAVAGRSSGRTPRPGITPCFELPSQGELVHDGRKLVGSAQFREGGAYLQHGSILVDDDQAALASLSSVPLAEIPAAATLRAAIGRSPTPGEMADVVFDVVRRRWDAAAEPLEIGPPTTLRCEALRVRYQDDAWTWRR